MRRQTGRAAVAAVPVSRFELSGLVAFAARSLSRCRAHRAGFCPLGFRLLGMESGSEPSQGIVLQIQSYLRPIQKSY
jgi:hypothetical protein